MTVISRANFVHDQMLRADPNNEVVLYHFCDFSEPLTLQPSHIYRSVLKQLYLSNTMSESLQDKVSYAFFLSPQAFYLYSKTPLSGWSRSSKPHSYAEKIRVPGRIMYGWTIRRITRLAIGTAELRSKDGICRPKHILLSRTTLMWTESRITEPPAHHQVCCWCSRTSF